MADEPDIITIIVPPPLISEIYTIPVGPPGRDGEGDLHYTHDQMTPLATWNATHGLGKIPSVVVLNSAGEEIECDVQPDPSDPFNKTIINSSAAFAGKAYFN